MRISKKILNVSMVFLISMSIVSCENAEKYNTKTSLYQQDINQLYIDNEDSEISDNIKNSGHLNYDIQYGKWISYLDYSDIMLNKSEEEFRNYIKEFLSESKSQNINTIYFQARAFGDAYYESDIFPKGTFLNNEYDPLKIFIEEAHNTNISVHVWINPLRCQTAEEFKKISDEFITKKWFNEFEGEYIVNVDGRMWLNPAYSEVTELIVNGILEIIKNYDADGIHIDDYFYPTVSEDFDADIFKKSGQSDLSKWRIENINKLVSEIFSAIKDYDEDILFGISPQGNINQNYNSQFADVKKWCSETGFCDYIVPQIYFGFKNDSCPFDDTFNGWYNMTKESNVSLIIGLAVYKQGKEDTWAGSGKNEWIDDPDVIKKQQEFISEYENVGFSLYY